MPETERPYRQGPRVRRGVLHGVRCHLYDGAHKAHPFIRGDQKAWCSGG